MEKFRNDQVNFTFITETSDVERILPILMSQQYWGADYETGGLDPFMYRTMLFQLGNQDEQFLIDTRTASLEPLRPFLESRQHFKIFHYAKFDYKMARANHNIKIEGVRCTFITEKVLQAGKFYKGFSLEALMEKRLGVILDKSLQKSFIGHTGPYTLEQKIYGARDVAHLKQMYTQQCNEGIVYGLAATIVLENEVVPAFADMEFDGMYLDVPAWQQLIEDNKRAQIAVQEELESWTLQPVNLASAPQVLKMLNSMGVKIPVFDPKTNTETLQQLTSTDAKSLQRISENPIIKLLGQWRSYNALINTFGEPYINAIHPKTGKIHMNLDQMGTGTGRPTAGESDVNPLNIPKENRYRRCFIGGPNEVVESDDYSGCESRILGELSGDPKFISIFKNKEDIHSSVGTELYGIPISKTNENARFREPAKIINLAIPYGRGVESVYNEIIGSGFKITFEETQKIYSKYHSKYSVAVNYLRRQGELAVKQGYLANLNGRRRYWDLPDPNDPKYKWILSKIKREAQNFPIQSVNADITKQAMIWNRDYVQANRIRSSTMNAIYDEIVTRTHVDDSPQYHAAKQDIMIQAAHKWMRKVPMEVTGVVQPHWTK